MKRSLCFIFAALILFAFACGAYAAGGTAEFLARSAGYATVEEYAFSLGYGEEWSVFALARFGADFGSYERSLDANIEKVISPVERERCALALAICGADAKKTYALAKGAAGAQGIMSVIFGLHLCANGMEFEEKPASAMLEDLISMQLADGGFALFGTVSDVDVTAMALQAMAEFFTADGVAASAEKALAFLSGAQKENGGFVSFGNESSESISQVIIALSSLGIDCMTDARFIKNGNDLFNALNAYSLNDGSYEHVAGGGMNRIATVQALCAEESYKILGDPFWKFELSAPDQDISEEESRAESSAEEGSAEGSAADISAVTPAEDSAAENESRAETASAEISAEGSAPDAQSGGGIRIKLIILCVLAALAAAAICVLIIKHKANFINICVTLCIFAALAAPVLFLDIVAADDYYGKAESKEQAAGKAFISIRACGVEGKDAILEKTELEYEEGATVYDLLIDAARVGSIPLDVSGAGAFVYVRAIDRIYERAHGDLSGWVYTVNGVSASVGCASYTLNDGDVIEWLYTTDGIDRTGTYENS